MSINTGVETNIFYIMFVKTFAAIAALSMVGGAAHAGYYVNTEVESDFKGGDYDGTELEVRAGFEGELSEKSDWYVELGPTTTWAPEDGAAETELGVEFGADYAVTDKLTVEADIEVFTADSDNLDFATTVGARYNF